MVARRRSAYFGRDRASPPAGRGVVLPYGDDPRRRDREGIGRNTPAFLAVLLGACVRVARVGGVGVTDAVARDRGNRRVDREWILRLVRTERREICERALVFEDDAHHVLARQIDDTEMC